MFLKNERFGCGFPHIAEEGSRPKIKFWGFFFLNFTLFDIFHGISPH